MNLKEADNIFEYSANGLFGHPYSSLILKWFDPREYLESYPDLQVLLEHQYDYEALLYHFTNRGFYEKRIYCYGILRSFDPDYYRNFCNEETKLLSNNQLMIHWIYEGIFRGYAGSKMTDTALNARFQIFNVGRVGSYSVVRALEKSGYNNIIHTHSDFEFSRSHQDSCLTFTQLMEIKFMLNAQPPLFIISGVRDPISWALSSISRYIDTEHISLDSFIASTSPKVIRGRIYFMLNFFKNPLFAKFNIFKDGFTIFGNGFNAKKGYGLYKFGKHRLLIYRVDKLGQIGHIIGDMIGCKDFEIEINNQSTKVASSNSLNLFMENVFDANLIEVLRESDYMQYFFTSQEQYKIYNQL